MGISCVGRYHIRPLALDRFSNVRTGNLKAGRRAPSEHTTILFFATFLTPESYALPLELTARYVQSGRSVRVAGSPAVKSSPAQISFTLFGACASRDKFLRRLVAARCARIEPGRTSSAIGVGGAGPKAPSRERANVRIRAAARILVAVMTNLTCPSTSLTVSLTLP